MTQRSGTLGLIVPNIESRLFARLSRNLELRCREQGYALFITTSDDLAVHDVELVDLLQNRGVEGIFLVMGNQRTGEEDLPAHLEALTVPYVLIDRVIDELACDKVLFDNELGGYLATRHLLRHGHRSIACLVNARRTDTGRKRLAGYARALEEFEVPFRDELVFDTDYYIPAAYEAAGGIAETDATAVFASSDNIALGLLKRLYEEGRRVPRDYSVVSYDNSAADSLFEPALTAVEQDVELLSREAFALLARRLEGDGGSARNPASGAPARGKGFGAHAHVGRVLVKPFIALDLPLADYRFFTKR